MTRKLEDLRLFIKQLIFEKRKIRLSEKELEEAIAEKWGFSPYIIKNTKETLLKFNIIYKIDIGIIELIAPPKMSTPEEIKKAEEEAAKELEGKFGI
jgi:predicted DNA-binding transcriptional regulator